MAALLLGSRAAAASVVVCSGTALVVGYTADHLYPMSTLKAQLGCDAGMAGHAELLLCGQRGGLHHPPHAQWTGWRARTRAAGDATPAKERERLAAANAAARKVAQTQLHQMGYYDTLTGLPNRRLLMEHIETAQTDIPHQHSAAALVYPGLDDFRTLNEARGFLIGRCTAVRVAAVLRTLADAGTTVARVGGDEFAAAGGPAHRGAPADQGHHRAGRVHPAAAACLPLELEGANRFMPA